MAVPRVRCSINCLSHPAVSVPGPRLQEELSRLQGISEAWGAGKQTVAPPGTDFKDLQEELAVVCEQRDLAGSL